MIYVEKRFIILADKYPPERHDYKDREFFSARAGKNAPPVLEIESVLCVNFLIYELCFSLL